MLRVRWVSFPVHEGKMNDTECTELSWLMLLIDTITLFIFYFFYYFSSESAGIRMWLESWSPDPCWHQCWAVRAIYKSDNVFTSKTWIIGVSSSPPTRAPSTLHYLSFSVCFLFFFNASFITKSWAHRDGPLRSSKSGWMSSMRRLLELRCFLHLVLILLRNQQIGCMQDSNKLHITCKMFWDMHEIDQCVGTDFLMRGMFLRYPVNCFINLCCLPFNNSNSLLYILFLWVKLVE